jgi:hypothetical protein
MQSRNHLKEGFLGMWEKIRRKEMTGVSGYYCHKDE